MTQTLKVLDMARGRLTDVLNERSRVLDLVCHYVKSQSHSAGNDIRRSGSLTCRSRPSYRSLNIKAFFVFWVQLDQLQTNLVFVNSLRNGVAYLNSLVYKHCPNDRLGICSQRERFFINEVSHTDICTKV